MNDIVLNNGVETLTIALDEAKKMFCPTASDKEMQLFGAICQRYNLDPYKREVYIVKYAEAPATILVGYEVYLKRAERSGHWDGFEVITEGEGNNLKAIVKVFRKDWNHPLIHEAYYSEYVQYGKKKDGTKYVNKFWNEKPRTMIKKVAISQAFRMAFPDELGEMPYTQDEINSIQNIENAETVETIKTEYIEMPESVEVELKELPKINTINLDEQKQLIEYAKKANITTKQIKEYTLFTYEKEPKELLFTEFEEVLDWLKGKEKENVSRIE